MASLRDVQLAFIDGVLNGSARRICSMIAVNGLEPWRRLAIYRNNASEGFLKTLAMTFPVVQRLAGEDWFRQTGREYMRRHPSHSGNLHQVGEHFAQFLHDALRATEYAYFAEVARLEWAYQEVLVAADHATLDIGALSAVAPEDHSALSFELHPAVRLIESPYPILAIWKMNQAEAGESSPAISLDAGISRVAIIRRADHVELRELRAGEFALLWTFSRGETLEAAAEAASSVDADIDLGASLARLAQLGAFADFSIRRAVSLPPSLPLPCHAGEETFHY